MLQNIEYQMNKKLFYPKRELTKNPINDRHYQELLWLNPTLSTEIKKNVENALFEDFNVPTREELNDNSWIISQEEIEIAKKSLINELEKLSNLTQELKHIIIVMDDCFTNFHLLILLRKILWKENYKKYVKVTKINFQEKAYDKYLESNLETNNSLIILWWSFSDTYSIDSSHYDSYLSYAIKQSWDEYQQGFLNKRFLWICFWQQYLANIIWIANRDSSWITATIKWPPQFCPSNCNVWNHIKSKHSKCFD